MRVHMPTHLAMLFVRMGCCMGTAACIMAIGAAATAVIGAAATAACGFTIEASYPLHIKG